MANPRMDRSAAIITSSIEQDEAWFRDFVKSLDESSFEDFTSTVLKIIEEGRRDSRDRDGVTVIGLPAQNAAVLATATMICLGRVYQQIREEAAE